MRASTRREMREGVKTKQAECSFVRDTGRLWNQALIEIKETGTIGTVKQIIKTYCKTLPI